MIVVDAAAVVEVVLATPVGVRAVERLLSPEEDLHAPHLVDVEVAQVLRRLEREGRLTPERAIQGLDDLGALPIQRHAHGTKQITLKPVHGEKAQFLRALIVLEDRGKLAIGQFCGFINNCL